jgi:hypothetical protein
MGNQNRYTIDDVYPCIPGSVHSRDDDKLVVSDAVDIDVYLAKTFYFRFGITTDIEEYNK